MREFAHVRWRLRSALCRGAAAAERRRVRRLGVLAKMVLAVAGLTCIQACASVPLPRSLAAQERQKIDRVRPAQLRAGMAGCAPTSIPYAEPCATAMRKVSEILEETGWFSEIGASAEGADLTIEIQPVARRPYWSTPAHNPALLLLSLAIPFWWSDTFGVRFSAEDRFGHTVEVDTTREGYRIMWSLAPLFNLSSGRGLVPSSAREADQVKLQLLPVLSEDAADAQGL